MKADDASLARLVANAQRGDKQSYATLLMESRDWLRKYFAPRVAPAVLEDLVQETLISVHRKMATFDTDRPFTPWLAAVARHRWIDNLRRAYRADKLATITDVIEEKCEEEAVMAKLSLDSLFGRLSRGQAEAIRLVRIEGRSIAEAAGSTGQSQSLVKVNIHRGIKKLTAIVEKE